MNTIPATNSAINALPEEVVITSHPPLLMSSSQRNSMEDQPQPVDSSGLHQDTQLLSSRMSTVDLAEEKSVAAVDKHTLKRLSTAMSLASDSEDEPSGGGGGGCGVAGSGSGIGEKLFSRNSAICYEDLKMNTVSGVVGGCCCC